MRGWDKLKTATKTGMGKLAEKTQRGTQELFKNTQEFVQEAAEEANKKVTEHEEQALANAIEKAKILSAALQKWHDRIGEDFKLGQQLLQDLENNKNSYTDKMPLSRKGLESRFEKDNKQLLDDVGLRGAGIVQHQEELENAKTALDNMLQQSNLTSKAVNQQNRDAKKLLERVVNAQNPLQVAIAKAQTLRFRLIFDMAAFPLVKMIKAYFEDDQLGLDPTVMERILGITILNDSSFNALTSQAKVPPGEEEKYQLIMEYVFALRRIEVIADHVAFLYEQHWDGKQRISMKDFMSSDLYEYIKTLQQEMRSFSEKGLELEKKLPNTKGLTLPDADIFNTALQQRDTGLLAIIFANFNPGLKKQEEKLFKEQEREKQQLEEKQCREKAKQRQRELKEQLAKKKETLEELQISIRHLKTNLKDVSIEEPQLEKTTEHENKTERELANIEHQIEQQQAILQQLQTIKKERQAEAEQREREAREREVQRQRELEEKAKHLENQLEQIQNQVTQLQGKLNSPNVDAPPLEQSSLVFEDSMDGELEKSKWEQTPEGKADLAQRKFTQMQGLLENLKKLESQHKQEPVRKQTSVTPKVIPTTGKKKDVGEQSLPDLKPLEALLPDTTQSNTRAGLSTVVPALQLPKPISSRPNTEASPRDSVPAFTINQIPSVSLRQTVQGKVVKKYETKENKQKYANYTMPGKPKPKTTSFWKGLALRNKSRDDMVDFVNEIAKSNAGNKDVLLYAALLVVKKAIEDQKPKYTSTLWCIAKELTDGKKIDPEAANRALSEFWKNPENKHRQYKKWDVEKAINTTIPTSEPNVLV